MVVHIAAVGTKTGHVTEWLRDGSVGKIYLLHSKKTTEIDFPKKVRELEIDIKKQYPDCIIIKRVIENAFNLDDTQDAITEIIYNERDNGVENQEIAINVTGGTNVQGAAAVLSAYKHGTKAYYIKNRKKEKLNTYVEELPIPSIGIAKMNKTQQKVLELIMEGRFVQLEQEKIYDRESNRQKKITKDVYANKITGKMTNIQLLKMMKLDEPMPYSDGQRTIKKGTTKIYAVVQKLKSKGYIIIHKEIPALEKIPLRKLTKDETSGGRYDTKKITVSQVMYESTPAGRRQAKDSIMTKE